jgi:hypothetical protein
MIEYFNVLDWFGLLMKMWFYGIGLTFAIITIFILWGGLKSKE